MKVYLTALAHPSAVVRGRWQLEPCQERYLRRLLTTLREGKQPTIVDTERPPAGAILRPSLAQLSRWSSAARDDGLDTLAIDIENAGDYLLCVGLTPMLWGTEIVGQTLCLPFRVQGGHQYWRTHDELIGAIEWLNGLLADPTITKVFHFGLLHDVPFLRRLGFDVEGRIVDTAALAHTAFTELNKGLQFLSTLYVGAPVWKHLTEESDEEDGKS